MKRKSQRILSLILALLTVLYAFASCSKADKKENEDVKSTDTGTVGADEENVDIDVSGIFHDAGIEGHEPDEKRCVWSDLNTVTVSMYTYFFCGSCMTYIENNKEYVKSLGYTEGRPLKDQKVTEDMTWYEYLMGMNYREVERLVTLADGASLAGIKLDEDDYRSIEAAMDLYKNAAEKAGMNLDSYIEGVFNSDVNECTVRKGLVLETVAKKYYMAEIASKKMSEDELKSYFDSHKDTLSSYDCITLDIESENKGYLTGATDEKSFIDGYRKYLSEVNFKGTADKLSDTIETMIEGKYLRAQSMKGKTKLCDWIRSGASVGDIYTVDHDNGFTTLTMVIGHSGSESVMYRNDTPLKKYTAITFGGESEAKSVLSEYEADKTEDNFLALSEKYGGKTEVGITEALEDRDIRAWLFDKDTKDGDVKLIVRSNGECVLVCKHTDGEAAWLTLTKDAELNERLESKLSEIREKHKIEYASDKIYDVKE